MCSTRVGSSLFHKHQARLESIVSEKHSGLPRTFVNYGRKRFIIMGSGIRWYSIKYFGTSLCWWCRIVSPLLASPYLPENPGSSIRWCQCLSSDWSSGVKFIKLFSSSLMAQTNKLERLSWQTFLAWAQCYKNIPSYSANYFAFCYARNQSLK